MKFLMTYFKKYIQVLLYFENYDDLLREIKYDLNKWRYITFMIWKLQYS